MPIAASSSPGNRPLPRRSAPNSRLADQEASFIEKLAQWSFAGQRTSKDVSTLTQKWREFEVESPDASETIRKHLEQAHSFAGQSLSIVSNVMKRFRIATP